MAGPKAEADARPAHNGAALHSWGRPPHLAAPRSKLLLRLAQRRSQVCRLQRRRVGGGAHVRRAGHEQRLRDLRL